MPGKQMYQKVVQTAPTRSVVSRKSHWNVTYILGAFEFARGTWIGTEQHKGCPSAASVGKQASL